MIPTTAAGYSQVTSAKRAAAGLAERPGEQRRGEYRNITTTMNDISTYRALRARVEQLSHDYYQLNLSSATDDEFDRQLRELARLEHELKLDDPTSPTRRVGGAASGRFIKVEHERPMLSLDNVFTEAEIVDFFAKATGSSALELMVEPKIDGLSLSLVYKDGKLARAVTRGDGRVGDDVTANARTIKNIPLHLDEPGTVEVRGEVYMPKSVFETIVKAQIDSGDEPFANARNAAAGSLKQKDSSVTARRGLKFIACQAHGLDGLFDCAGQLASLRDHGFTTPLNCVNHQSGQEVNSVLVAAPGNLVIACLQANRDRYEFETDGVVLKVRDMALREELGLGTKSPKWACALKFPPERKVTRLLGVTCQAGRTGTITPVAELEPVFLSGATVKRASLMNADELVRIGSPSLGDDVFVERSAEIIPRVVGIANKTASPVWTMPDRCPCCQCLLKRDEGTVAVYCPNYACPDQVFERLKHAVSKPSLDLDGCGEAMVRALIAAGVTDLAGLFEVERQKLDGVGNSALAKFLRERERVKQAPVWRKYHSLGIELAGQTACKELALAYPTILDLAQATDLETRVGPVRAKSIRAYLEDHAEMIERLDAAGFKFSAETVDELPTAKPLQGRVLCITGSLVSGTRDAVAAKIEAAGGLVKGSVGKKTDYLIIGELPGAGKTGNAAKYGTKILTEEELYGLLGTPLELAREIDDDDL